MDWLVEEIPDAEVLLSLPVEELAGLLLSRLPRLGERGRFHRDIFHDALFNRLSHHPKLSTKFPPTARRALELAFNEGMRWLEYHCLILPDAGTNGINGWMLLTRRGERIAGNAKSFASYREAAEFPKSLVHPSIADKVWPELLRGDLDDAVFAAFKAVEIAVRESAGYKPTDVGKDLMYAAFKPNVGPLADRNQPIPEQEALMHLFASAIASYKNPHSHRTVSIQDPREAQEMVVLASHLLRIVESRTSTGVDGKEVRS